MPRMIPEWTRQAVCNEYRSGRSMRAIASDYHISFGAVRGILIERHVPLRNGTTPESVAPAPIVQYRKPYVTPTRHKRRPEPKPAPIVAPEPDAWTTPTLRERLRARNGQ
jgi:hypothetical protein